MIAKFSEKHFPPCSERLNFSVASEGGLSARVDLSFCPPGGRVLRVEQKFIECHQEVDPAERDRLCGGGFSFSSFYCHAIAVDDDPGGTGSGS